MKSVKLIFSLLIVVFLTNCSVVDKYSQASDFYQNKNYVIAIELYDNFLKKHPDGALSIKSKLERSDCYYQLGYEAYKKQNWILASRLFFLANSKIADRLQDNSYYKLSEFYKLEGKIDKTLEYYEKILKYLPNSELTTKVLYNRIQIYLERENKYLAFNDYHVLWKNFPESEYTKKIQPQIDNLLPFYIEKAITFKDANEYDDALSLLFKLNQYPTKLKDRILTEIGNVYLLKAENAIQQNKLKQAKQHFDNVLKYKPQYETLVKNKKKEVCSKLISKGNSILQEHEFDKALKTYQKCFILDENNQRATSKISKANKIKQDYSLAFEYKQQAAQYEKGDQLNKALEYYKKSYAHYHIKEVSRKLFIIRNMINSEKDPKGFARSVVRNHNRGRLNDKIMLKYEEQKTIHGEDIVKASGWKISYAVGKYKYEVRYDILTPDRNYYYAWRIDLRTQELNPSNKLSEEIMNK